MSEEWRPWRSGDYEVSNLGNVRRAKPGRRTVVGQLLKPIKMKIGYLALRPVVDGKNVQMYVHAMVCECFLGPKPDGCEINHIDGNKTNPCLDNLEYVSHGDNMRHAKRSGLLPNGERHGNAKLTDEQASELRIRRKRGEKLSDLSKEFGIANSTASQIVNNQRRVDL